jgi:hypothetical protein
MITSIWKADASRARMTEDIQEHETPKTKEARAEQDETAGVCAPDPTARPSTAQQASSDVIVARHANWELPPREAGQRHHQAGSAWLIAVPGNFCLWNAS